MCKHLFVSIKLLLVLVSQIGAQQLLDVTVTHNISDSFGFGDLGGGASFVDIDGDGLDDLSLPSEFGDSIHVYLNTGGSFQKIGSPIAGTDESKQLLWCDLDNDGDRDLYVSNRGAQNRLYENTGGLTMVDITSSSGLPQVEDNTFGACIADYDRDGLLDLFICNYSEQDSNQLYRNNGNLSFTNVTATAGLTQPASLSFQASFLDYNNDNWPDIFIAIDKLYTNKLFENNGDGTFQDVSTSTNLDYAVDAMNAGFGDINNDNALDIYITNGPAGNLMHINNGSYYVESAVACGTTLNMNSWGGNFFDCNNDGLLDLYVNSDHFGLVNNALFVNQDSCMFTKYVGPFSGDAPWSFASAIGDYDNDGQQDLVINQAHGQPYLLLRNLSAPASNHWIKTRLTGCVSNTDGIGAWIKVSSEGRTYGHFTHAGTAYLAQNTFNVHFGLDTINVVDSIEVFWPSGIETVLYPNSVDTLLEISEDAVIWEGTIDDDWDNPANWAGGSVPSVNEHAWFAAGKPNYPVITTGLLAVGDDSLSPDYVCASLWVQPGATLTCSPSSYISNHGIISVSGILQIQNISDDALVNHAGSDLRISSAGIIQIAN